MLPLHIVTLALNAHPLLLIQLSNLNRCPVPWTWHIVHGTAANTGSTAWCRRIPSGLSTDGTTELLRTWRGHPRIRIYERPVWHGGKDEMFNYALGHIVESCVLLQADADEFWAPVQLAKLVWLFGQFRELLSARFYCDYFVGPNIVITSTHSYGNRPSEWARAWRFQPGQMFKSHEPPVINGASEPCADRDGTRAEGLVFQHWAWVFEWQVAFKERLYGYRDALRYWKRLQANRDWPVRDLRSFLTWVDPGVIADQLWKPSTSPSGATATFSLRSQLSSTIYAPA